jgi:hypothetical protein
LPGGHWGYPYFGVTARYARNMGVDYLGMTARFHRGWADFGTLRNQAALDYECFRMLAQAGKCSIGDQLHPRGRLLKAVYQTIGNTYRSVEEKEPWCQGAEAVTEIGFLATSHFFNAGELTQSDKGTTNILSQLHYQFDVLDGESDFSRYKLIILPDYHRLDGALLGKAEDYLAKGGKLILSHESGLSPDGKEIVLKEAGVDYVGPSKNSGNRGDYIEITGEPREGIPDMIHFTYEIGSEVTARPGTTVLARRWKPYFDRNYLHFSSHFQTPYDQATKYVAASQQGNVIYIAFPVFEAYALNSYFAHKQLVAMCLRRLLPNPLVRAEAPSTAEVTVTRQEGRQIVHLLHYPAERRSPDLDIIEDVIPLVNVNLQFRLESAPKRVYLAPQRQKVAFEYKQGYARVTVPEVRGHQMVVFET